MPLRDGVGFVEAQARDDGFMSVSKLSCQPPPECVAAAAVDGVIGGVLAGSGMSWARLLVGKRRASIPFFLHCFRRYWLRSEHLWCV
jgi:hypothetical protein